MYNNQIKYLKYKQKYVNLTGGSNSLVSFFFPRLEKERLNRLEKERLEKERLEKERLERLEKERLEKERLERLEKERLEKKRLERFEKERIEKERLEKNKSLILSLKIQQRNIIENKIFKGEPLKLIDFTYMEPNNDVKYFFNENIPTNQLGYFTGLEMVSGYQSGSTTLQFEKKIFVLDDSHLDTLKKYKIYITKKP